MAGDSNHAVASDIGIIVILSRDGGRFTLDCCLRPRFLAECALECCHTTSKDEVKDGESDADERHYVFHGSESN